MTFELDGVTFPAAEVRIEFLDPADGGGALFPSGALVDDARISRGSWSATGQPAGDPDQRRHSNHLF